MNKLPAVMEVDELVDAALAGFDRRETITIPTLPDANQWTNFESARKVMTPEILRLPTSMTKRRRKSGSATRTSYCERKSIAHPCLRKLSVLRNPYANC